VPELQILISGDADGAVWYGDVPNKAGQVLTAQAPAPRAGWP
jgi:hypothetical protein